MAAPNLLGLTTVTAKTSVQAITTSATNIVTNSGGSNTAIKINALYVSNINTAPATVNIDIYRSTTAYRVGYTITVPNQTTLDLISKIIYLEEGDSLRLTASINNYLEAVCSYEVIS